MGQFTPARWSSLSGHRWGSLGGRRGASASHASVQSVPMRQHAAAFPTRPSSAAFRARAIQGL